VTSIIRFLINFCQETDVLKSSSEEELHADAVTAEPERVAGDAKSTVLEPNVDWEMEKYMTIVRQQREKEKMEKQVRSGSWTN